VNVKYVRPTRLTGQQIRVLHDTFNCAPWHPVLPMYEDLWRDREHPSAKPILDRIHDEFAKARLRGTP
jgi:hypothetical protein